MPWIVFDGQDGSGKSTQQALLKDALERLGEKVITVDHPSHTGLGGVIRKTLFTEKRRFNPWTEAFLYAADQAQTLYDTILPADTAGKFVLCHRWLYSSFVYQSMLDGAEFCDVNALAKLTSLIVDGDARYTYTPDVSFLFVVDAQTSCDRIAARTEDRVGPYERAAELRQACAAFTKLTNPTDRYSKRTAWLGPRILVDTTDQTIDQTHKFIMQRLAEWL